MTEKKSELAKAKRPVTAIATPPSKDHPTLPDGIVDVGAAMQAAIPGLQRAGDFFKRHCETVRAEMAKQPPEVCEEHEDVTLEVDWEQTFGLSWRNDKLTPCYKRCPKCLEERGIVEGKGKWLKMGIPVKNVDASLDKFIIVDDSPEINAAQEKVMRKVRKQLAQKRGFLIFLGPFGSGKSYLASAILMHEGSGIFVTEADLIGGLRQTYSDNVGQDAFVAKYRDAKVLVLDELTTEVKGVDIAPLLYRILADRYDKGRITVVTSNETLEVALEILGGRLVDRIRESYVVCNLNWPSRRKPIAA